MDVREIIWLDEIVTKIEQKHRVSTAEVEQVVQGRPMVRRLERGRII